MTTRIPGFLCSPQPKNGSVLRLLRLFAAIQWNCLSMNHLHAQSELSQSSPIKANQGNYIHCYTDKTTTKPLDIGILSCAVPCLMVSATPLTAWLLWLAGVFFTLLAGEAFRRWFQRKRPDIARFFDRLDAWQDREKAVHQSQ